VASAAEDPDVLAIKQTLYRTSGDSPVVRSLERAAECGKQVTVLVELLARFDEQSNIRWSRRLEESGCHVIYGIRGYKTHSKILLVVRRGRQGIRRYVHLGTGNYNESTARIYTDFGLMTSDAEIGEDASAFFNALTGYSDPPRMRKLVMAPTQLRERIVRLIGRERQRAEAGQAAEIRAKLNSLVDEDIIRALYDAAKAGVRIRLAVRGICCLRPGPQGRERRASRWSRWSTASSSTRASTTSGTAATRRSTSRAPTGCRATWTAASSSCSRSRRRKGGRRCCTRSTRSSRTT
jgi:polyphosphate kinase